MSTQTLAQTVTQMHEDFAKLTDRLAQLTEEDLSKPTPHAWAPTVGDFLAAGAHHARDHGQHIAAKRAALNLEQTVAQKILADVAAAQGELDGAVIGLTDDDLETVPEGQTWSLGQVVEHVAGTYGWFLSEIEKALSD